MRSFLTFFCFVIILLLIGRNMTFLPKFSLFSEITKKNENEEIKKQINEVVSKQKGAYSVYFYDLKSNENFGINEKQILTAASVNKLPIIAVLYYLNQKGKLDLNEKIILQKEDIQDYGTGSLRYEEPGGSYSLRTLARLSLKQSDNTASHILATKIGMDSIQKTVNDWGLIQTNMVNNQTTAYDMFLILKKIYKGEVANKANTIELLSFLTNTDIEDRLPLFLKNSANVYHKTGDAVGNIHDVGIIEKGETVFFLAVMTSDIGDRENETKKIIGEIAKKIFDYKQNQKD